MYDKSSVMYTKHVRETCEIGQWQSNQQPRLKPLSRTVEQDSLNGDFTLLR